MRRGTRVSARFQEEDMTQYLHNALAAVVAIGAGSLMFAVALV
jgi:hypothetical protein